MKPDGRNVEVTVGKILDEEGKEMESAPASQTDPVCGPCRKGRAL